MSDASQPDADDEFPIDVFDDDPDFDLRSGSDSCSLAASARITLIWVRSPTAAAGTIGSRTGIKVQRISQAAASRSVPAKTW